MIQESFSKWMFVSLPARRLRLAKKYIYNTVPEYYTSYVSRVGSVDKLSDIFDNLKSKQILNAFKEISGYSLKIKGQ